jgi:hypothetical protein
MHETNPLSPVVTFLVEELRETRARVLPASAEFQFQQLLWRSSRRTRRWEALAEAMKKQDAETTPTQ